MKIKFLHDVSGFMAGEADVHPDVAARHVGEGSAVYVKDEEEKPAENPALSPSENTGSGEGVQTEGDKTNPDGAKAPEENTNPENV